MDELADKLKCSIAVQQLWPGVGKTTGWWTRSQTSLKFTLRCDATGEKREFARPDVPVELRNAKAEADTLALMSNPLNRARFQEGKI
jgi:hypothetical protein